MFQDQQNSQESQQFGFLDAITLISFIIQLQNQSGIIGIRDVQKEVDRAIDDIHAHLKRQDEKIDEILDFIRKNEKKEKIDVSFEHRSS